MDDILAIVTRGSRMENRKGNGNFNDCFTKEGRMEKTFPPVIPITDDPEPTPRQTNPFIIANVLETIFPYLDHSTLKSCRVVSHLWNHFASPLIYQRSKVDLDGPFTDPRSESFLSTMYSTTPEGSLPMSTVTFNVHHTEYSQQNLWFFINFGRSIRSLTIQAYALQNPANALGTARFLRILSTILARDTPFLENLTITHLQHLDYNFPLDPGTETFLSFTNPSIRSLTVTFEAQSLAEPPRRAHNCMALLGKLLAIAPNISALHTECRCSGETFLYFLMTLRDSGISNQLKEFTVNGGPFDNFALTILNEMEFPKLKSLWLNTLVTKKEEVKFYAFLEKLSPTLEKFVMVGDKWGKYGMDNQMVRWDEGFSLDFPLMPKVKLFRHQNYEGLRLGGEEFLQKLPSLEEIVIRDFQPSLGDMMLCPHLTVFGSLFSPHISRGGKVSQNTSTYANTLVKKVTIDVVFVPSYENLGCIHKLLRMFPNVEEMEMAISFAYNNTYVTGVLEILSQSWIKKLKITFYQCNELRSNAVLTSFHGALMKFIPKFCHLQKLDFILEDLPVMSRINLPLRVVKGMMSTKALVVANFTGFSLGETPEETEACRELMDDKLTQWTVKEHSVPFAHFSCFDY